MRGDRFNFNKVMNLENGTKIWVEQKYRQSGLFIVKNINYGINFIIDKYLSTWDSFFLNYTQLEIKIDNGDIKIYEWLSNDKYLNREIEKLRIDIEVALILCNKAQFIMATTKYNNLIKEREEIKLINN